MRLRYTVTFERDIDPDDFDDVMSVSEIPQVEQSYAEADPELIWGLLTDINDCSYTVEVQPA